MAAADKNNTKRRRNSKVERARRQMKPCFDEAVAPSSEWRRGREDKLGYDPDAVQERLQQELGEQSDVGKRSALEVCLQCIPRQVEDVDTRLAMIRFHDALGRLLEVANKAVSAAATREKELEHWMRDHPRPGDFEPHLAFARMVASLPEVIKSERDWLTNNSASAAPFVDGTKGGRPQQVAVTVLAEILEGGGYSHAEIATLLAAAEVEQRLRRARNALDDHERIAERGYADQCAKRAVCMRDVREHAGLTQGELAKRLGKSETIVSQAESGMAQVKERYVRDVLTACGLPEDHARRVLKACGLPEDWERVA